MAVAMAVLLTAGVLAATLVLVNRADWWRGLLPATVGSALAAMVSLLPLAWGVRRGLYHAAAAFFVAGATRAAVSIGACLLAVLAGGYPMAPTLLLMVPFYFAVLAVEATMLGRAMWSVRV